MCMRVTLVVAACLASMCVAVNEADISADGIFLFGYTAVSQRQDAESIDAMRTEASDVSNRTMILETSSRVIEKAHVLIDALPQLNFFLWGCQCHGYDCNACYVYLLVNLLGLLTCMAYLARRLYSYVSAHVPEDSAGSKVQSALHIPGVLWCLLCILSIAAYIGGSYLPHGAWHQDIMGCALNVTINLTFASTFHIWMSQRSASYSWGYVPFTLQILLVPWITTDRMPFPWQPMGCPNWLDFIFLIFSFVCGTWAALCPSICLEKVDGGNRRHDEQDSGVRCAALHVPMEALQVLCACLSLLYLQCCAIDVASNSNSNLTTLAHVIYHLVWSYLRPSYAALFALYWLKRSPGYFVGLLQAVACGIGFGYFFLLCPLSVTAISSGSGMIASTCSSAPANSTTFYATFHNIEATCLYLSWVLFFLHALNNSTRCGRDEKSRDVGHPSFADIACAFGVTTFAITFAMQAWSTQSTHATKPADPFLSFWLWILEIWGGYVAVIVLVGSRLAMTSVPCQWWQVSVA